MPRVFKTLKYKTIGKETRTLNKKKKEKKEKRKEIRNKKLSPYVPAMAPPYITFAIEICAQSAFAPWNFVPSHLQRCFKIISMVIQ